MPAKELKRGDPCPNCRGELKPAYVPTDEEFARAVDKENPVALPLGADTANTKQREELGELHRCTTCGYQARFPQTTNGGQARGQAGARDTRSAAADRGQAGTAGAGGPVSGQTSTTGASGAGGTVDPNDPDWLDYKRRKDEERSRAQG